MKKTYFQKTYSIIQTFFFLGFISMGLYIGLTLLNLSISNLHITVLEDLISVFLQKLDITQKYLKFLTFGLLLISILLLCIELIKRIRHDSLWNYFKSLNKTRKLRQFLRQEEKIKSVNSIDDQTTVTKINPILEEFNQTVDKSLVDVRIKSIVIYLQYPKTQQAQKLLKNMENHIMEEISNQNPDYYFSTPSREGNSLWYIGTKR